MNSTRPSARSPGAKPPKEQPDQTRPIHIFYQQGGITVTDRWFVVAGRRYPLSELSRLRTARGPHDTLTIKAGVLTGAVLAAIGALLTALQARPLLDARIYLVMAVAALVPLALAMIGYRFRPRPWELWGEFRGTTVQLFYSEAEHEYGQVTRALMRAKETSRLGATPGDSWDHLFPWQYSFRH